MSKKQTPVEANNIIKQCQSATVLKQLIDLWNYVAENKKMYSIDDILEINLFIRKKSLEVNGSDFERGRFYWDLKIQYNATKN